MLFRHVPFCAFDERDGELTPGNQPLLAPSSTAWTLRLDGVALACFGVVRIRIESDQTQGEADARTAPCIQTGLPTRLLQLVGEAANGANDLFGAVLDLDDHRAGLVGEGQTLSGLLAAVGHFPYGCVDQ